MTVKKILKNPIDFFGNWAEIGKDEGMEKGHNNSVQFMIGKILENRSNPFSFLDAGCGNGWVVKQVASMGKCSCAVGIDGAVNMIKKARLKDQQSDYLQLDINNLDSYKKQFDIVFSMEVLYYLRNPKNTLSHIYSHLLNDEGCCIIGIDHYLENKPSLTWEKQLNVPLCTYSISEWTKIFISVGFKNVNFFQFGKTEKWAGTLILYAEK